MPAPASMHASAASTISSTDWAGASHRSGVMAASMIAGVVVVVIVAPLPLSSARCRLKRPRALVAALAGEVYATLLTALAAVVSSGDPPIAQLGAWIDGALHYARDPALAAQGRVFVAYETRVRAEHPGLYRSVGRALTAQVATILERGCAEGVVSDTVSTVQARLVVRLVIATLEHHVLERTVPSSAERDALVAFVLGGCKCR